MEYIAARDLEKRRHTTMTCIKNIPRRFYAFGIAAGVIALAANGLTAARALKDAKFTVEEATIADIQQAILSHEVTTTDVVKLYLARIKAYNGTCVNQP